ncbi:hypothetical protein GCM10009771_04660 [Nesterenkonia flava]
MEFVMLSSLLLIPLVYFLVALAQVQAAAYATLGAADQASKMYTAPGDVSAQDRAARSDAAAAQALADFGIDSSQARVTRQCPDGCDTEGGIVIYTVEVRVPLPLIPQVAGWEHTLVTVSTTSAQVQNP